VIVDIDYYNNVYLGETIPAAVFPQYAKRAGEAVSVITYGRVTDSNIVQYPEDVQTAYRSAVCAQIEYYAYNGISAANDNTEGSDYSIGRISVSKPNISAQEKKRGNRSVCAAAVALLETTGLMCPARPAYGGV
jgi:hypothetical protein